MNKIISSCVYSFISPPVIGCNPGNADAGDLQHSTGQIPVFDIAMQGVNPDWFVRGEFQSILWPIIPLELENVRLLNEAEVTPSEALRTATLNLARVLGLADSLGSIERGKLADLILLDTNPPA